MKTKSLSDLFNLESLLFLSLYPHEYKFLHRSLECTGYLIFTSLMFHVDLFFLWEAQSNMNWWNGWLNCWTRFYNFYPGCCISDTFLFASMIYQLLRCMDTEFLVSFDISSLFANIPLDETISICVNYLYRCYSRSPTFPEHVIIELMKPARKFVSFSFNDIMYRQVDGISMESPVDTSTVNILQGSWNSSYLTRFINLIVDDSFSCFPSCSEALNFFIVWIDFILPWPILWKRKKTICQPLLTCKSRRVFFPFFTSV